MRDRAGRMIRRRRKSGHIVESEPMREQIPSLEIHLGQPSRSFLLT